MPATLLTFRDPYILLLMDPSLKIRANIRHQKQGGGEYRRINHGIQATMDPDQEQVKPIPG